jgi:hypothetical protein
MHNHNMQTLTVITSGDPHGITSLARDLTRATISPMPRRTPAPDLPVMQALAKAAAEYDEADRVLREKDAALRAVIVEAAREAADKSNGLTLSHIADKVGWTRETVNRIATKAHVRQRALKADSAAADHD